MKSKVCCEILGQILTWITRKQINITWFFFSVKFDLSHLVWYLFLSFFLSLSPSVYPVLAAVAAINRAVAAGDQTATMAALQAPEAHLAPLEPGLEDKYLAALATQQSNKVTDHWLLMEFLNFFLYYFWCAFFGWNFLCWLYCLCWLYWYWRLPPPLLEWEPRNPKKGFL